MDSCKTELMILHLFQFDLKKIKEFLKKYEKTISTTINSS